MAQKDFRSAGFSILFADDQKFMLKNLERYFKNMYNVETAATLEEAKQLLDQDTIGVAISDHQMANGQGIHLLEYIRDTYPEIRRILITADRHEELVIEMMENDLAHSFAYKPTVKEQLHTVIDEQSEIFLES